MAIGLANKTSKDSPRQNLEKVNATAKEFTRRFKELHGSINCTGLLGYNLSKPDELAAAMEKKVFITQCPEFVSDAIKITEELLKQK
jgi:hypothetical protein